MVATSLHLPSLLLPLLFLSILFANHRTSASPVNSSLLVRPVVAGPILCYTAGHIPPPRPFYVPTQLDCAAAAQKMGREPNSARPQIITSVSSDVPEGGYLYPHGWQSGTCAIIVKFDFRENRDVATLLGLGLRARQVSTLCVTDRYKYGGEVPAGEDEKLIVSVRGGTWPHEPTDGTGGVASEVDAELDGTDAVGTE